jgi:hypothetical protein
VRRLPRGEGTCETCKHSGERHVTCESPLLLKEGAGGIAEWIDLVLETCRGFSRGIPVLQPRKACPGYEMDRRRKSRIR